MGGGSVVRRRWVIVTVMLLVLGAVGWLWRGCVVLVKDSEQCRRWEGEGVPRRGVGRRRISIFIDHNATR